MFWLCEPFGRLVVGWSGSVTDHHKFLLFNQTYVLGNVRPELFFVYSCWSFLSVAFIFYNRYSCFYLLYLVFKGIFHLGVLISINCHLQNGSDIASFHLLNTILRLCIFNVYSKYFITKCDGLEFCCWTNLCVSRGLLPDPSPTGPKYGFGSGSG